MLFIRGIYFGQFKQKIKKWYKKYNLYFIFYN